MRIGALSRLLTIGGNLCAATSLATRAPRSTAQARLRPRLVDHIGQLYAVNPALSASLGRSTTLVGRPAGSGNGPAEEKGPRDSSIRFG